MSSTERLIAGSFGSGLFCQTCFNEVYIYMQIYLNMIYEKKQHVVSGCESMWMADLQSFAVVDDFR